MADVIAALVASAKLLNLDVGLGAQHRWGDEAVGAPITQGKGL